MSHFASSFLRAPISLTYQKFFLFHAFENSSKIRSPTNKLEKTYATNNIFVFAAL